MERLKDDEFTRALLKSIRQTFPYSYAQIKSYEHFMDFELQRIIQEQSLSIVRSSTTHQEHEVVFKRVVVGLPSHRNEITQQERITPQECRDRGLMYQCPIFVDVVHKIFKYDPDDSMDGKDSNVHDEDRKARRVPLDETRYIEVPLAFMPAMVQSKYCHLSKTLDKPMECSMDRGGYFVVRQDRAIMLQERMRHNQIFLFESKTTNRLAFCEVRSCHEKKIRSTSTLRVHITKPRGGGAPAIVVSLPFLSCDVPLVVLYRLLGTDLVADSPDPLADVVAWVGPSPDAASTLRQMLHHETNVLPTEDLYEWLASGTEEKTPAKRRRYIEHLIDNELLPHLNPLLTQSPKNPFTLAKKRMFLGAIVNMLLDADAEYRRTGAITFTDRDDYQYKRIAMAGEMIGLLFRQLFRQFIRMLRSQMVKITEKGKTINMADIIQPRRISVGLQYSFATGIWAAKSDNSRSINNQGITQIIGRMNSLSLHSQLTRVNTAVMKEGNSIKKRLLGLSHYGYLCPSSTPEGQSCGLVKELSLVCYIRQGVPKLDIAQFLTDHADELGVDAIFCPEYLPGSNPTNPTPPSSSLVTVNGDIFGSCRDVGRFVRTFKLARRNNLISFEVTVTKSHFGVELSSDRGVLLRPVFVLSECRQRLDTVVAEHTATARRGGGTSSLFAHLHHHGLIEYVCSCEQKDLVIATTFSTVGPSHTHVEIHPSGLLGVCTSFVPHSDRNQAPRNMYSAAMVKQSINYSSMTQHLRFETQSHVPYSVQHPLVQTWFENIAGCAKIPNGCNVIAAIISRDGYNQEDSIVVNKDSVDRGLFHSSSIRTIKEEETTTKTDTQTFTNPMLQPGCVGMRMANYNHLDEQGTCRRGTVIKKNDVIVGKTMTTTETNDVGRKIQIVRDKSKVYMGKHDAVVDDTINVLNRDGNNVRKTKLRQPRVPEVGDKFCYTEDHELLTKRGWVPIKDVELGERVAIYDNGHLCYEPTLDTLKYAIEDQPLYEVVTQQFSLKTTMNHRMFVKKRNKDNYELVEAQHMMGKRVRFLKNCKGLRRCISPPCPVPTKDIKAWLFFFGFWIGDGWVENYQTTGKKRAIRRVYRTTIAQIKSLSRKRILDAATKCGLHPIENGDKIHFNHKTLTDMLAPLSVGAPNKRLPSWCFELSKDHSMCLLKGLIDSDRTIHKKSGTWRYYTSSLQLKDDVQRLVLHAGWSANVKMYRKARYESEIRGRKIISKFDQWHVLINRTNNSPQLNHGHAKTQNSQVERVVRETGFVYCVTVRTGIIYVRRHGKPVWCGNCSRHGQKGTCGIVLPGRDMAFTMRDGITADIVMNPHAIPSRMTIGHLAESVQAKAGCLLGKFGDGTPFRRVTLESICDELKSAGFEENGYERMICGKTGKMIEAKIFIGVVYYRKLKHMSKDKMHARTQGPTTVLTRQPVEGRSRSGGLRVGEMERDCLIAAGASSVLLDRLFEVSDKFFVYVCENCKLVAIHDHDRDFGPSIIGKTPYCNNPECQKKRAVCHRVELPYSCHLLLNEARGINVCSRMTLKNN